jgi:hypothetical protein
LPELLELRLKILQAAFERNFVPIYNELEPGHLNKTVADFESQVENSARFWSAAALRRFSPANQATQSGGGPPHAKTLARR